MSLWFQRREADGRRANWAVPFEPLIGAAGLGLVGAVLLGLLVAFRALTLRQPTATGCAVLTALFVGLVMLGIAKGSVMRRGTLVSFGPARMTRGMRYLYFAGYAVLAIAALLACVFIGR